MPAQKQTDLENKKIYLPKLNKSIIIVKSYKKNIEEKIKKKSRKKENERGGMIKIII